MSHLLIKATVVATARYHLSLQDISTPIQESVQHTQVIPDGTPPSTIHIATSGRGVRRKAKLPSVPPPSPVMGGGSYLPSTSNQGQSHTIPSSTLPGHDSSLQGLGPVEPNEVKDVCVFFIRNAFNSCLMPAARVLFSDIMCGP